MPCRFFAHGRSAKVITDFALAAKSVKKHSGGDASSCHEVVLHGLMPVTGSRRLNCYQCLIPG